MISFYSWNMRKFKAGLASFSIASFLASAPVFSAEKTLLDDAIRLMYNNDFSGSHRLIDRHVDANPYDPLAYTFRSTAYLFAEFDRLGVLESELFSDDSKLVEKKKLKADPAIRTAFFQAIEQSVQLAGRAQQRNPKDTNALFALTTNHGLISDYTAFIDKRHWSSYQTAKQAHSSALRLLETDPQFYDAMLSTGMNEYLVGSIPVFLRWFVRFEQTKGSKDLGREQLWKVARNGRYFGPFARILLAVIYLREKDYSRSEEIVLQLSKEFPSNKLLAAELSKLREKINKQ